MEPVKKLSRGLNNRKFKLMTSYIFLGPPASGKGTQAKELAEKLRLVYFGTGEMMRSETKKDSEFGRIFRRVWDKGHGGLVDDKTVLDFAKLKLEEISQNRGFVFDGFPRTLEQAAFLERELNQNLIVFNIQVSEESIVDRSSTRMVCGNCGKIFFRAAADKKHCEVCGGELIHRIEDTPEIVKKRLDVYNELTQPLINYYKEKKVLINIDGENSIEDVKNEITVKINERK